MNEKFKKAYEEYTHDIEDGSLSLPCCIDEYEGFAKYFYNLALADVKAEVDFLKDKCAMVDAVELKEFIDEQRVE